MVTYKYSPTHEQMKIMEWHTERERERERCKVQLLCQLRHQEFCDGILHHRAIGSQHFGTNAGMVPILPFQVDHYILPM
jgi:hypothetical protein